VRKILNLGYLASMTSIELEEHTAQALRAQAKARNLTLGVFLKHIAEASAPLNAESGMLVADLDRLIDAEAGHYPSLPAAFSRADIYDRHDQSLSGDN